MSNMKSIFSELSAPSSSTSYSAYRETTRLRRRLRRRFLISSRCPRLASQGRVAGPRPTTAALRVGQHFHLWVVTSQKGQTTHHTQKVRDRVVGFMGPLGPVDKVWQPYLGGGQGEEC